MEFDGVAEGVDEAVALVSDVFADGRVVVKRPSSPVSPASPGRRSRRLSTLASPAPAPLSAASPARGPANQQQVSPSPRSRRLQSASNIAGSSRRRYSDAFDREEEDSSEEVSYLKDDHTFG